MSDLSKQLQAIYESTLGYRELAPEFASIQDYAKSLTLSPAAVCVLFRGDHFETSEILLTERTQGLRTHQGQIAFPGGSVDPQDQNLEATALRECEEEVGIPPNAIEVVGMLPPAFTLTGSFQVSPLLGVYSGATHAQLVPEPNEVATVEWVKVQDLKSTFYLESRIIHGVEVQAPVVMWGNRKMWGLSAWIFDLILRRYDTLFS